MKIINMNERHRHGYMTLMLITFVLLASGCDVDDGIVLSAIPLPTDSAVDLFCEDAGINTEACILDDPDNPYANATVNEDTKFVLNDDAPSAKSRFYLWATALARSPTGENQYYTALSLHELFAESSSPTTQAQAKTAYRSVLDNFFLSATFFVVTLPSGDVSFAAPLKDIVGANLHNPTGATLVSLYTAQIFALSDMSQWGYIYDTTNLVTNKRN